MVAHILCGDRMTGTNSNNGTRGENGLIKDIIDWFKGRKNQGWSDTDSNYCKHESREVEIAVLMAMPLRSCQFSL